MIRYWTGQPFKIQNFGPCIRSYPKGKFFAASEAAKRPLPLGEIPVALEAGSKAAAFAAAAGVMVIAAGTGYFLELELMESQ